ncbi:MAG: hypothetical protein II704_00600 [Erysipelotrichaceae bacterium]|nr:hypothetical protein [Erysipelotrichaceae bacterium]
MSKNVFSKVLLFALPASGKSEVRNFMAKVDPAVLRDEFHIGETIQLDDFPYVFMMRRIDEELMKLGQKPLFYASNDSTLLDERDWGTLINLLNEDYYDLMNRVVVKPDSYARHLFTRIDNAALKAGIPYRIAPLSEEVKKKVAAALEERARFLQEDKHGEYPETMEGKTIIVEAARGGAQGAEMPLNDPMGYQYSLRQFCPEMLEDAVILYIYVTPEESRRKNEARSDPNDPGSILHHGVPIQVMLDEYGCDDMLYLRSISEKENTITVEAHGKKYHLPIGVFDNREDKTTFLRGAMDTWKEDRVLEVIEAIRNATDIMYDLYSEN